MFPLVRDLAAEGVPVRVTCGVLGFSTQAFYKWKRRPCSDRDWADAHAINAIVDVHADDPEFGYRFIADELEQLGQRSCERRVWRLCSQQRIWSTTTKKGRKVAGKTPGPAVYDDLVQRQFTAPAPDVTWLTDITEHPTLEGKLYCCSIKDVFSNRIVGYALGDRMTAQLAVACVALRGRSPPTRRHRGRSLRPGQPVPLPSLPSHTESQRAHRVDGTGRLRRRQRSDGIVLLAAPEERAEPPAPMADPQRAHLRDRLLD